MIAIIPLSNKDNIINYSNIIYNILISNNYQVVVNNNLTESINKKIRSSNSDYQIIVGYSDVTNNTLCIRKKNIICVNDLPLGEVVNYFTNNP